MKQIPTSEEYLALFAEWLPKPDDDWTRDDKLAALLHYISAATANLASHVDLYRESTGKDISDIVIRRFLNHIEMFLDDEEGKP